jgi:hypothetical protein
MYYYGYQGGYGYNSPCCGGNMYPGYGYGQNNGYGASIILVLFILLVIVIGARWLGNN